MNIDTSKLLAAVREAHFILERWGELEAERRHMRAMIAAGSRDGARDTWERQKLSRLERELERDYISRFGVSELSSLTGTLTVILQVLEDDSKR